MNTIERNQLLTALYQVTSKSDLVEQFDSKLLGAKGTTTQRYTFLLEQVLFYSHAIIFGHGVQTAHNYRQSFMTTAKNSKLLKLDNDDIEKAFSFLNRTEKKSILKEAQTAPKTDTKEVIDDCVAISEITRLKAQLDTEEYELAKGQKVEDKEIFIKIALVALSTGARLKDIMGDLTVSTKKGVTLFNDIEGVILVLDTKTVQSYLKAIRSHYSDRIGKVDISTGIRKAVKRLSIKISQGIIDDIKKTNNNPKTKKQKRTDLKYCENTNHLTTLYRECLTSSIPK